jgi:hypothetical protein
MKLRVTQVPLGSVSIEGLVDDKGTFYVSVSQTASLFSVRQSNYQKDIKALLPADSPFVKFTSEATDRILTGRTKQAKLRRDRVQPLPEVR